MSSKIAGSKKLRSTTPKLREQEKNNRAPETQFAHFVETARKLGCDEDKERFEKSLGKIAAYKPPKKESSDGVEKPKTPRKKAAHSRKSTNN